MKAPKEKTLDKLWGEVVILEAGEKCARCGRGKPYLNPHHIFSRSNRSVRFDLDNGICLCSGHHTLCNDSAHKAPLDFAEWIKKERGEKWYNSLRLKANTPAKPDRLLIYMYLREKLKQLNK